MWVKMASILLELEVGGGYADENYHLIRLLLVCSRSLKCPNKGNFRIHGQSPFWSINLFLVYKYLVRANAALAGRSIHILTTHI